MKNNELKNIVELYTVGKVKKLDTYPDPNVPSCTSLRVKFEDGNTVDYVYFLIQRFNGMYDRDSLEEVEFESWPPESSRDNMMKAENLLVTLYQ